MNSASSEGQVQNRILSLSQVRMFSKILSNDSHVLVPENRLLSELYLANKAQYHAKSRVVVGEKNGETSQVRRK